MYQKEVTSKSFTQLHLTLLSARSAPINKRLSSLMSFSKLFCNVCKHLTGLMARSSSSAFRTDKNQVHCLYSSAALHQNTQNKHQEQDCAQLTYLLQSQGKLSVLPFIVLSSLHHQVTPLPVFSGDAGIVLAKLSFQSPAVTYPASFLALEYNEISTKVPRYSKPLC